MATLKVLIDKEAGAFCVERAGEQLVEWDDIPADGTTLVDLFPSTSYLIVFQDQTGPGLKPGAYSLISSPSEFVKAEAPEEFEGDEEDCEGDESELDDESEEFDEEGDETEDE